MRGAQASDLFRDVPVVGMFFCRKKKKEMFDDSCVDEALPSHPYLAT